MWWQLTASFSSWNRGSAVVLEVPHREDPMVQRLLAHKEAGLHADYEVGGIEALVERHFVIDERIELPGGTRTIYRLRRRGTSTV